MGKLPLYLYTDSETEDAHTSSSGETVKKKKFSILKFTTGSGKKKKCTAHSHSEPEDLLIRSRSSSRVKKLRGILKNRERESSDEDEELDVRTQSPPTSRYLVGRVPRPAGTRPGRGGGVALVVRKNTGLSALQSLQAQASGTKRTPSMKKRLTIKQSF